MYSLAKLQIKYFTSKKVPVFFPLIKKKKKTLVKLSGEQFQFRFRETSLQMLPLEKWMKSINQTRSSRWKSVLSFHSNQFVNQEWKIFYWLIVKCISSIIKLQLYKFYILRLSSLWYLTKHSRFTGETISISMGPRVFREGKSEIGRVCRDLRSRVRKIHETVTFVERGG